MGVLQAVEPEAIPVAVLEEPDAVEHQCFAQVQVGCFGQVQFESRRHKTDQAVDPISLGNVLDSGEVEMSALMRSDLQLERRTREVQFVVISHNQPICAVPGIGARRQAAQLQTPCPEQYDHDSELLEFVVLKQSFHLRF